MDLFGTTGIRGPVATKVTPELALSVGRAAGEYGEEFVIARDGRRTGLAIAAALEAGLESAGADVVRIGMAPTPALSFASYGRHGVMITASHNPSPDNGIKFFVDGVEYTTADENRIEERIDADPGPAPWDEWGRRTREEPLAAYRDAVVEYARAHGTSLDGMTIAVDAGNGVAALGTPSVLRRLGATVHTLHANVDGHFPGRPSKPSPENITDLTQYVREREVVDLGIAHDGDGDRIVVVDSDGSIVHEDTILAVLSSYFVEQSDADDSVVMTTPNVSGRVDEAVRAAGGRVERTALGLLHEGIAEVEAKSEETAVAFAGEPWKCIHPELGIWTDGIATAAVLSRLIAAEGLDALLDPITERPLEKKPVDCPEEAKADAMERLSTTLPEQFPDGNVSLEYGVRIELPDASWFLVRPSGTEPYIRVYAESDDAKALLEEVRETVKEAVEAAT
ncbi:phosphohexomutase domain-containing protein [Halorhabdus amylolytica]|uniref:phosphomannomutase n=1 Tax=Halorhabdus amylolytica TaxID=2559573 RepID=UPI0010AB3EC8|nr:phosphomannomutase [Halorhabdus amylolytica]